MDIGGGGPSSKDKANMSAKEIDELLKRGAYDVFREDDSDQREFEEADIDSILERRARKVDLSAGGSGMSASLGEKINGEIVFLIVLLNFAVILLLLLYFLDLT